MSRAPPPPPKRENLKPALKSRWRKPGDLGHASGDPDSKRTQSLR